MMWMRHADVLHIAMGKRIMVCSVWRVVRQFRAAIFCFLLFSQEPKAPGNPLYLWHFFLEIWTLIRISVDVH